jgi:hypothetical protein
LIVDMYSLDPLAEGRCERGRNSFTMYRRVRRPLLGVVGINNPGAGRRTGQGGGGGGGRTNSEKKEKKRVKKGLPPASRGLN